MHIALGEDDAINLKTNLTSSSDRFTFSK